MNGLPISITLVLALLAVFFIFITALKYAIADNFKRTRLSMTAFFFFIVCTLTISFWHYTFLTLWYTIPAFITGILIGYFIGVNAAKEKLAMQGMDQYMKHFAHVHWKDVAGLNWWSLINFYSVMSGLLLINFVGLSTVIFHGSQRWAIFTSAVGAFLLGSIVPYLIHLWKLHARR